MAAKFHRMSYFQIAQLLILGICLIQPLLIFLLPMMRIKMHAFLFSFLKKKRLTEAV